MSLHHFGTDGVRGEAGVTLTDEMAYRIGRCLGQYPNGNTGNRILVSRDTRISGDMLNSALIKGLINSGATIYDEGVSTTPSISYLVENSGFDYGIMISASHNPYGDNGIKIFNREGEKLSDDIEEVIEAYMDKKEDDLPLRNGKLLDGSFLKEKYIDWLVSHAPKNLDKVNVLVDCANGSASAVAPMLYKKLGLHATFINAMPNGTNINAGCGSTHLESLQAEMRRGHYDLGFAFDGDADRFMAISKEGRVIDGDAQIYLSAIHYQKEKLLKDNQVVITVMSNFGLRKALEESDIAYQIVPVGDKNVQAKLKEDHLSLGGEQSGHVIYLDDLNTGDGLLSSLKLLSIYLDDKKTYSCLSKLKVYPQVLNNIVVPNKELVDKILKDPGFLALEKKVVKQVGDSGRVLVRASGTEPLIRVMAESLDPLVCKNAVQVLSDYVKEAC